jgi:hypothetical protein
MATHAHPLGLGTEPQRLATNGRLHQSSSLWVAEMERTTVDWPGLRVVSIEYFAGVRRFHAVITVPMDIIRALVARIQETAP